MFWYSVFSALKVMTYWETHVAFLGYLSFLLVPIILVCFIIKKRQGACLKYLKILFLPILEAIAISVFVLTLFPIIFGLGEDASWGFPLKIIKLAPGGFLGLLGILMVVAIIMTFIPKAAKLHPFKTLVLGGISLVFVQIYLSFLNPIIEIGIMDLVPGFWFILGCIFIAGGLSKIGHFISVSVTASLGNKFNLSYGIAELLILPVTALLGFIPVFVYGAWLA